MTVSQLHEITSKAIADGHENAEVAINYATFLENEEGSILTIDSAAMENIQGADDGGPVGEKYPFLVISGGFTE